MSHLAAGLEHLSGYMGYLSDDQPTPKPVIEPFDQRVYYTLPKDSRLYILASDAESALRTYEFVLHQMNHSKWR